MNNQQIIQAAAKMGYSASIIFCDGSLPFQVVAVNEKTCFLAEGQEISFRKDRIKNMKVTGFLYVGRLFGEPVIPADQKFRIKDAGIVCDFSMISDAPRDMIEPVFE